MRCALVLALLLAACGHGDGAHGATHGFRHCMTEAPPADRQATVGGLGVTVHEGAVRITSQRDVRLGLTTRVAGTGPIAATFDLLVVLGGLGDGAPAVSASLRALAATDRLVLLVLGGDDEPATVRDAVAGLSSAERERVIDVSAASLVEVGAHQWVPVPGAPRGRYARSASACGFDHDDLDARAESIRRTPTGHRRHLLAWALPAGGDAARGIDGVDAGDADLAAFMHRVGATGGLFAWPDGASGQVPDDPTEARIVARPLAGPAVERPDGSRTTAGPPTVVIVAGDQLHPG